MAKVERKAKAGGAGGRGSKRGAEDVRADGGLDGAGGEVGPGGGLGAGGGTGGGERPGEIPRVRGITNLDQVTGHVRAKRILRDAMANARLHHAWIFSGPQGVGKFTAAIAFAGELLGGNAAADARLMEGTHPDLHVICKELASVSRVDTVRRSKQITIAKAVTEEFFLDLVAVAPAMPGGRATRVFIIDEAELLDRSASDAPVQNTMLKVLEEPPPGVVIILVTTDEGKLLPTVRSRCQRVVFGGLTAAETLKALRTAAASRGVTLPSGPQLDWVIQYADGSVGTALQAVTLGLFAWQGQLDKELAATEQGLAGSINLGKVMADLVEEQAERQASAHKLSSKEAANRYWAKRMLQTVAGHYRRQLAGANRTRALRAIEACSEAERYLGANTQLAVVFETLSSQLAVAR